MTVSTLDHINIRTPDVAGTSRFFADVLEMTVTETPGIPDPDMARWICDQKGDAIIHVVSHHLKALDIGNLHYAATGSGRIHHIALRCENRDRTAQRLERLQVPYHSNEVPQVGLRQLFITDPNGILLELNFFES